jgi:glutamine synthetase
VPSSDANPYLVILMILAGIRRRRDTSRAVADAVRWGTAFAWDFAQSIETFAASPIVRSVLSEETIELYSTLKKGEAAKAKGFDFTSEVDILKSSI